MRLNDCLMMVVDGLELNDPVRAALMCLVNMVKVGPYRGLDVDLPDFSPSIEDLDVVLFDLAEAISNSDGDQRDLAGIVALVQGVAHVRMSQDGSGSETTWIHDGFRFSPLCLNVPLATIRCPECGREDSYEDFWKTWSPMKMSGATCPTCREEVEVLVVAVTLHVVEGE